MNLTKKLICTLAAGATLGVAAPVFAEPGHDRGFEHRDHYSHYDRRDFRDHDRHAYRDHDRHAYRGYDHRRVVVERPYYVQRPYIVEQPVYYSAPAPNYGLGAMIGAAVGGYIDSQR